MQPLYNYCINWLREEKDDHENGVLGKGRYLSDSPAVRVEKRAGRFTSSLQWSQLSSAQFIIFEDTVCTILALFRSRGFMALTHLYGWYLCHTENMEAYGGR